MADKYTKQLSLAAGLKESLSAAFNSSIKEAGKLANKELQRFGTELKSIFNSVISNFKISLTDTINEMNNILAASKLSNANTRELAFKYGFNSSQVYGWQQASSMLGFESEEDLFYANQQELQQFREAFEKYSDYYTKLYDSGFFQKMQEFNFEMQDFKQEMQIQVIDFFMENKDTIVAGMNAIMKIADITLKGFQGVLNFLGYGGETLASSDIINNYSGNNKTTTLNINNTFNGDAQHNASLLANLDVLTYEQTIKALGGR